MASSQLVLITSLLLALAFPPMTAYDNVPAKSVEKTAQVVVEGMVYCQSCDNYGSWSLSGAKSIAAAKMKMATYLHRWMASKWDIPILTILYIHAA
ncbi:putative two-component response regulator ARR1-like [Capsicum annuum]|nr:putative two-component response regulator ARR1-like [Capsicum annuum]